MSAPEEFDYTVVLVFPGFGAERESAEAVVESALDWLNTYKETPGFRFARPVSAHLEIVADADEVRDRIESDESVAMVLLHDLDDDMRDELVRLCNARQVGTCYTVDAHRPRRPRNEPMKVVFRRKEPSEPSAHTLCAETPTAPVGDDEDTQARVGEVIAVLALGVMSYHWGRNPPSYR
jgi:hypothetical protein